MEETDSFVSYHSKVRVIAKIRDFTKKESESSNREMPWICVYRPNDSVLSDKFTISIGDQPASRKDMYELDYCYQQNEDIDSIFSREIQPLISEVFEGRKASVVAYGARGSGKTYTIQGSEEKHGLATLALAEIFRIAKEKGNSVTVSLYEIFQEHIYDLSDSNLTEVQVLEDANGKIKLKGLSRVTVESTSEFYKLYYKPFHSCKSASKSLTEVPRRSHRGLIINLLSCDENSNKKLVGKMNFVDLAGYEASKGNGCDESTRINKSLYSFQNVVNALVANEGRVPYRGSKLARVLQDSLVGRNRVVMLTCLNPLSCQDTVCTLNLSLRPCQTINQVINLSQKKVKSSAKPAVVSSSNPSQKMSKSSAKPAVVSSSNLSQKKSKSSAKPAVVSLSNPSEKKSKSSAKPAVVSLSNLSQKKSKSSAKPAVVSLCKSGKLVTVSATLTVSATIKKQPNLRTHFSKKKACHVKTAESVKGRKLFNNGNQSVSTKQELLESDIASVIQHDVPILSEEPPLQEEKPSLKCLNNEMESTTTTVQKDVSPCRESNWVEETPKITDSNTKTLTCIDDEKEKENMLVVSNESPPLSVRLREISNSLKSLSATPFSLAVNAPQQADDTCFEVVEPKTPVVLQDLRVNSEWEPAEIASPWGTFSVRSSGVKQSLVQDYIQFLNSASKEQLKSVKGIGEKRATYILELREESPEPFKTLEDLEGIGLSMKQVKGMMKQVAGDLFV